MKKAEIQVRNGQVLIDGKPRIIIAGEVHYYRLEREEWQDRLSKLKAAGMNAVASYIPWLCHEEEEGVFDFGQERENLDIEAFIELCAEKDLYFIARPGPFIMAEMKNEGIPYWVAERFPELVPTGWEHRKTPTKTLDYLAPDFLHCVDKWYEHIMPILERHLIHKGGNVIACQLDNEIGMLSWVSNTPDLTDVTIADFERWLERRLGKEEAGKRYPFGRELPGARRKAYECPRDDYAMRLHRDLGWYMRERYARYADTLKRMAQKYGVRGIPFLINIHGTGGGRGYTFPIGISQLMEAYGQSEDFWAGSDIYLSGLRLQNMQDLYLIHCYMEAVNRRNMPLASFEFQSGEADYDESGNGRLDVTDADFTARMCFAQGNRLINHYLFTGGRNMLLKKPRKDGNNRIAITGERHGFTAPVNPEGKLSYTYAGIAESTKVILGNEEGLASMREERDNVTVGFIPDYFMTEYCYPGSAGEKKMVEHLARYRTGSGWETFAKMLLLDHYAFGGVNLQEDGSWMQADGVLFLLSADYMAEAVQERLARFVENGGRLLLYGRMPVMDMEGNPCLLLSERLGIRVVDELNEERLPCLSVRPEGIWKEYAEVRTGEAEIFEAEGGEVFLRTVAAGGACGLAVKIGKSTDVGKNSVPEENSATGEYSAAGEESASGKSPAGRKGTLSKESVPAIENEPAIEDRTTIEDASVMDDMPGKAGMAAIIGTHYVGNRRAVRQLMEYLGAGCRLADDCEYGGIFLDVNRNDR
ncbi:MAG: beta-galactosidase, partial [Acetatifactor muris]|nr:beta-galactosidase [Acetatifactor muris]